MQVNNEFNIYKDGEGDEIRMGYRKSGLQADGERADTPPPPQAHHTIPIIVTWCATLKQYTMVVGSSTIEDTFLVIVHIMVNVS